ncbi:unnamed protein product, partial [Tilletia laevis]
LLGYVPSVLQPWSTVQNCPVPSLGDSVLLAGVWLLARLLLCAAHPIEEHCSADDAKPPLSGGMPLSHITPATLGEECPFR